MHTIKAKSFLGATIKHKPFIHAISKSFSNKEITILKALRIFLFDGNTNNIFRKNRYLYLTYSASKK
jgi:hypothetical protein